MVKFLFSVIAVLLFHLAPWIGPQNATPVWGLSAAFESRSSLTEAQTHLYSFLQPENLSHLHALAFPLHLKFFFTLMQHPKAQQIWKDLIRVALWHFRNWNLLSFGTAKVTYCVVDPALEQVKLTWAAGKRKPCHEFCTLFSMNRRAESSKMKPVERLALTLLICLTVRLHESLKWTISRLLSPNPCWKYRYVFWRNTGDTALGAQFCMTAASYFCLLAMLKFKFFFKRLLIFPFNSQFA